MITIQAVPTLESTCPASYQAAEKTWGGSGRNLNWKHPEALRGPSDWTGRQATFSGSHIHLLGRIWHSESIVEADKGSLEPSPHPAMARNEPQEESGGWATPETCSSLTVGDLDECSQSSRKLWREAVEGDPG